MDIFKNFKIILNLITKLTLESIYKLESFSYLVAEFLLLNANFLLFYIKKSILFNFIEKDLTKTFCYY